MIWFLTKGIFDVTMHAIHSQKIRLDERNACAEFAELASLIALGGGRMLDTKALAKSRMTSRRVLEIVEKTADAGAVGSDATESPDSWGSHLSPYQVVADAFLQSLSHASIFDAAVADMVQIPMRGRVPVVDITISSAVVDEAGVKPVSSLLADVAVLDPLKVTALVVISKELARLGTAPSIFDSELRRAVALGVDEQFLDDLISETTPGTGSGDPAGDFAALLGSIVSGADARIYVATTPAVAKQLAAFPGSLMPSGSNMTPTGGTLGGVRLMATDVLSDGVMVGFDASQLLGSAGSIVLSSAEHANVDMSGSTNPSFSIWQKNCVGLKAERTFGYAIPRSGAVASLASVSYTPGSPT